jgi:N-acetyl-1-D-myo-inositol-2-amino-2-deoxy-alpha-D-glucopyranoside deacetylase
MQAQSAHCLEPRRSFRWIATAERLEADDTITLVPSSPRLLAIFAHPDDESFCAGGALALLAARGVRVTVLNATRGDAGSADPALLEAAGVNDIAALRVLEMHRACDALGVETPLWLDYHDSGFHKPSAFPNRLVNTDPLEVAAKLLEVIRDLRPDVLMGFDPHGYYGHPDHVIMHRAVHAAFFMAGHLPHPPRRLFYPMPSTAMIHRFNTAGFGSLEPTRFAVHPRDAAVTVDATPVLERKRGAIAAHASQSAPGSGIDRLLPELREIGQPRILTEELYALGATRDAIPRFPLEDFFDGLE